MAKLDLNKSSTLVSLMLHISLVLFLLIWAKPISVLIPSRSDGLEVSLINLAEPKIYTPAVKSVQEAIKTLDVPAEVNLKQNAAKPIAKPSPPPEIKPLKSKMPSTVEQKIISHKLKDPTKKIQINDLLGGSATSNANAIRKGKALGGNPNGSSDSNNLIGNYADSVINAVRPYVLIPEDINTRAKSIVKVELFPNLNVKSVKLIKSSGNQAYDQNVQDAIMRLKVFPPLPDGARFIDYRILTLTFRPE